MGKDFFSSTEVQVLDFTTSVDRLANSIMILSAYYNLCIEDYQEYWRINSLIQTVVDELDYVMKERKKVRDLFLG